MFHFRWELKIFQNVLEIEKIEKHSLKIHFQGELGASIKINCSHHNLILSK